MDTSDQADEHEDFVTTYGDALLGMAIALCGDRHTADQVVDATLADLWSQRDRVRGQERVGWARARLASRWAEVGLWPSPSETGTATTVEELRHTEGIVRAGSERLRRRVLVGGAVATVAAGSAMVWRHSDDAGLEVMVGRLSLRLRQATDDAGARWLQVWYGERLVTALATPLETPTTVVVPLIGGIFRLFDGARLVVTWALGAWLGLDVIDTVSFGVHPATLRRVAFGADEVTVGFVLHDGDDQPPLVVRHDGRSFVCDQPRVITGFVDTPERGVDGYHVGPSRTLVLVSPVSTVLTSTHIGDLEVQRVHLGADRELFCVQTWGTTGLRVLRGGADLGGTRLVDAEGDPLVVVVRPAISTARPVEVAWIDGEGRTRSQEIT